MAVLKVLDFNKKDLVTLEIFPSQISYCIQIGWVWQQYKFANNTLL